MNFHLLNIFNHLRIFLLAKALSFKSSLLFIDKSISYIKYCESCGISDKDKFKEIEQLIKKSTTTININNKINILKSNENKKTKYHFLKMKIMKY